MRDERSEEWEDGRMGGGRGVRSGRMGGMGGGRVLYLMASGKTVVSSSYRE